MAQRPAPLEGLDLNLLVSLDALLTECSVTRAAEQLGSSQPTMSRALQTLRDVLGDELLVRSGRAMVPTPLADSLLPAVQAILGAIERLGTIGHFDAATSDRAFTLGMSDLGALMFLPQLIDIWQPRAPNITLTIVGGDERTTLDGLLHGTIDIAVGRSIDHAELHQRGFPGEPLQWVLLVGSKHPGYDSGVTLEEWFESQHVQILAKDRPSSGGPIDDVLERLGRTRKIALRMSHVATLSDVLERSNFVCTLPRVVAETLVGGRKLRVLPHPLAHEFRPVRLRMMWHERMQSDAGHAWLRNLVIEALEHSHA